LKQICTENNLLLHVDGARFFNAAVHLNTSLKQLSADAGVDILTLGGTKSGMMFGEAVIFFNCPVPNANKFMLKRSMQLASKNRFIAVQFAAMLKDELWKEIANHTNRLAAMLEKALSKIPTLEIAYPVETNAVFVKMPRLIFDELQKIATFYHWNEEKNEYRFMFSFNSTADEVTRFIEQVKLLAGV
jgi:threonine aldolase